jgi:hypothetical protein
MPPGCNTVPCIPIDEFETVQDWIDDGLAP